MSWFKGMQVWIGFEDDSYHCEYGDGMRMKLSRWFMTSIGATNYNEAQRYFFRARQVDAEAKFGVEFMEMYEAEYKRAKKCRAL